MREGIGQKAIHKLSDFLSNESGRVGAKSALAMGGLVGAAALTQMVFAPEAKAHLVQGCTDGNDCTTYGNNYCCCSYTPNHGGEKHFNCKVQLWCQWNGGICQ